MNNCQNCGWKSLLSDPDRHHIKTRGSGGTDDEWNIVYLCRNCHTEVHKIGYGRFCQKYPNFNKVLEDKGWALVDISNGLKKLIRK